MLRSLCWLLFVVMASVHTTPLAGEQTKLLAGYHYEETLADGASDDPAMPILVVMHWMGSTPVEFRGYLNGLKGPARLVFLRGRYPFRDGFSFYPVAPTNYYKADKDQQRLMLTSEVNAVAAFVDALAARFPHAPRPVVIGASQGGDLSYAMAVLHGKKISMSVPLLATVDERVLSAINRHSVPIHVFHGKEDKIVPIATVRQHVTTLRQAGYAVELKEYAGLGHGINQEMQQDYLDAIDKQLRSLRERLH